MKYCETYAKACARRCGLIEALDANLKRIQELIDKGDRAALDQAQKLDKVAGSLLNEWKAITEFLEKPRRVSFIQCFQGNVVLVVKNDDNIVFKMMDFVEWYNDRYAAELLPEELIEEPFALDEDLLLYARSIHGLFNTDYERIQHYLEEDYDGDGQDPTWYHQN